MLSQSIQLKKVNTIFYLYSDLELNIDILLHSFQQEKPVFFLLNCERDCIDTALVITICSSRNSSFFHGPACEADKFGGSTFLGGQKLLGVNISWGVKICGGSKLLGGQKFVGVKIQVEIKTTHL